MHSTLFTSSPFPVSSPIKGGIIPILEIRKLRHKKVKTHVEGQAVKANVLLKLSHTSQPIPQPFSFMTGTDVWLLGAIHNIF